MMGTLKHARRPGAVGRRARVLGRGREADLVVHDDVDRAADRVPLELRHLERLGHDALGGERGVAVDEDRQRSLAVGVAVAVLLRADAPLHHRVNPLEVARVERERQVHEHALGALAVGGVAEVVLHVAAAGVHDRGVAELGEDVAERLADDVREHVQPAAVRHADDDVADPVTDRPVHRELEERQEALGALDAEALRAEELRPEVLLERLRLDDLLEQPLLHVGLERHAIARPLHPLLEPAAQVGVVHVRELDAERAAVGLLEPRDEPAQRQVPAALRVGAGPVEVRLREPERRRREPLGAAGERERVEVGAQVAVLAVRRDQPVDLGLEGGVRGRGRCRRGVRAPVRTPRRERLRRGRGARRARQRLEVPPPALVHRAGIGEPLVVQVLDEAQVAGARRRDGKIGLG